MIRRHIDYHPADQAALDTFIRDVEMLAGLVVEMLETSPATVLSPYHRRMVVEKAKEVQEQRLRFSGRLCVDNPGEPLTEAPVCPEAET